MTPERYKKFRAVLEKRQPDLTVIADHIHKGRNMAAIRRTCDAMGVPRMQSSPKGLSKSDSPAPLREPINGLSW